MGSEIESAYPMYGLYVYGEGGFLDELRENVFTGIPVLYIPGMIFYRVLLDFLKSLESLKRCSYQIK